MVKGINFIEEDTNRILALINSYDGEEGEDFDELEELVLNEDFNMIAYDIKFSIEQDKKRMVGKDFLYVNAKTSDDEIVKACIPMDFLNTTILKDGFDSLCFYGDRIQKTKYKGRLISNKRQLFKLWVKLGVLSKANYPFYYKQAFEHEDYKDMLSEYFSYELLRDKTISEYKLTLDNDSHYFQEKAEKLKNLGANNTWSLVGIYDTLGDGYCQFNHRLRYLYVVQDKYGNQVKFGRKCAHDFFIVNADVKRNLLKFVYSLRVLQSDYLNAYLTDYEPNIGVEQLFIKNAIIKLSKDDNYIMDLNYAKEFLKYNLPVPRLLAYRLTLGVLKYTDKKEIDTTNTYYEYLASVGLNGIDPKFYASTDTLAISMLGDRIPNKIWEKQLFHALARKFNYSINTYGKPSLDKISPDYIEERPKNKGFTYREILTSNGFNLRENTYKNILIQPKWIENLEQVSREKETKQEVLQVIDDFLYASGLDLICKWREINDTLDYRLVKKLVESTKQIMLRLYRSLNIPFIEKNMNYVLTITDYNDIIEFLNRPFLKSLDPERQQAKKIALGTIKSYKTIIEDNQSKLELELKNKENSNERYEENYDKLRFCLFFKDDLEEFEYNILSTVARKHKLSIKQQKYLDSAFNRVLNKKQKEVGEDIDYFEDIFRKENP